jgi:hypothetical protein
VIRPSLLNRSELCGLAPVLSEQHPEEVPAGWHGTDVHTEIARCLNTDDEPILPQAKAAIDWLHDTYDTRLAVMRIEKQCLLADPVTMDVITEGTPDLVLQFGDGTTVVIDWKTGNPDNVREVDDNLQLIAYGLAVSQGGPFQCVLVFLDGLKATAMHGTTWQPHQHAGLLERIKAAAKREPVPSVGDWCPDCYVRHYCPAYQARLSTALAPVSQGGVAFVQATEGARWVMQDSDAAKLSDIVAALDGDKGWLAAAKLALKEHVKAGGTVVRNGKKMTLVMAKGRVSADVKSLEADGLTKYLKQGQDYETTKWVKP